MPQINDIRELAQQNARYVSNSPQDWMSYLDVAARLYRYSFTDALLIHAQRPDATACAELELWNQKMSRWVNRGAKGIALLDDTGPRTKLRYVFDIADTHLVRDPLRRASQDQRRMSYLFSRNKSLLHGCGLSSKGLPPSSCPAFFSCWTSICFLSRGQICSCGLHSKS